MLFLSHVYLPWTGKCCELNHRWQQLHPLAPWVVSIPHFNSWWLNKCSLGHLRLPRFQFKCGEFWHRCVCLQHPVDLTQYLTVVMSSRFFCLSFWLMESIKVKCTNVDSSYADMRLGIYHCFGILIQYRICYVICICHFGIGDHLGYSWVLLWFQRPQSLHSTVWFCFHLLTHTDMYTQNILQLLQQWLC